MLEETNSDADPWLVESVSGPFCGYFFGGYTRACPDGYHAYAGASGVLEPVRLTQLVDDALRIQESALQRDEVKVQRQYAAVQTAALDRTRVMQVLVNLLENARQAMHEQPGERRLDIAVREEAGEVSVSVSDSGCGIAADNLRRIFAHGFTTKVGGHGFGLHSCALAAQEMGGTLTAHSEGTGKGASFTLRLPCALPSDTGPC